MRIIGLCGRSGSGKSTVAGLLRRYGMLHIDADLVCRRVYDCNTLCVDSLRARFGDDIMVNGKIDRAALAAKAYGQVGGLADLNSIAHKYITEDIESMLAAAEERGVKYAVLDAPLLFESGLDKRCDAVLAVVASEKIQLERLSRRDGKSREEIEKRLAAQMSNAELIRRCDGIIYNRGTLKELGDSLRRALNKIGVLRPSGGTKGGVYRVKTR